MRRARKTEKINVVLDKVLKAVGLEEYVLEQRLISLLPKMLDKRITRHIKSYNVENRILFLKLDSPVWARELLFLKKKIMDKINEALKKRYLKNIMFGS